MGRVFVSSTFSDLADHRQALAIALRKSGHDVIEMETFAAQDERPPAYCFERVAEADYLVGAIAWRYGYVPPDADKSITELEYEQARSLGKPCFMFLLDENHPWLPKNSDPRERDRPRAIDRFRERLSVEKTCGFFSTPADLASEAVAALASHEGRFGHPGAVRRVEPRHAGSPPPPSNPLPGRFAAATIGRLLYWRAGRTREALRRKIFDEHAIETVLFPKMQLQYRARGGEDRTSDALVTIVSGPAGVGKSTYVSRLIANRAESVDLPMVLRGSKLADSGLIHDANVANEIRAFFSETMAVAAHARLDPAAVSHALNSRRILLIIEDLHHAGSANEALAAVRSYVERYHHWGERLHIVATTREPAAQLQQRIGRDAAIVPLEPLAPSEAQLFFYDVCTANGLTPGDLTAHGDALSKAFVTEGVRTPLFIVICAWLVSPLGGSVDLRSVLNMTASDVFDKFIRQLFDRSGSDAADYPAFRDFYEKLALALWPQWEDCRVDVVEAHCKALGGGLPMASVDFMQRNGFILPSRVQGLRVHFPHQSMADYLTAHAVVKHEKYDNLGRETIRGRVEGLVPFLAELLDEAGLLRLAAANFALYLAVLEARVQHGDAIPARRVVATLMTHAQKSTREPALPEAFARVRTLVAGRLADPWVREFIAALSTTPSAEAIETLAVIGPEADEVLSSWLADPRTRNAFQEAASHPITQLAVVRLLAGAPPATWRPACQMLLAAGQPEHTRAVAESLPQRLQSFAADDVRVLCRSASGWRLLADAVADQPLTVKQHVSSLGAQVYARALIPRGVYEISVGGSTQRVKINRSFLVPAAPEKVHGAFKTKDAIRHAVEGRLGKQPVMTEHQARVVFAYFSFSNARHGVLFAAPGEDTPEAFRISTNELGLFVIPSNMTALTSFASDAQQHERRLLQCRGIDVLDDGRS